MEADNTFGWATQIGRLAPVGFGEFSACGIEHENVNLDAPNRDGGLAASTPRGRQRQATTPVRPASAALAAAAALQQQQELDDIDFNWATATTSTGLAPVGAGAYSSMAGFEADAPNRDAAPRATRTAPAGRPRLTVRQGRVRGAREVQVGGAQSVVVPLEGRATGGVVPTQAGGVVPTHSVPTAAAAEAPARAASPPPQARAEPAVAEAEVARLSQAAEAAGVALERALDNRRAEEAAFKAELGRLDLTGDAYDTLLTSHHEQRLSLAVEINAANAALERATCKADMADALFAAEQDTRAKQEAEAAAEARLRVMQEVVRSARAETDEASAFEDEMRAAFIAA